MALLIFSIFLHKGMEELKIMINNSDRGRFQLFQGYYKSNTVLNKTDLYKEEEKNVFKVDTKTGEVWEYFNLSDGSSVSKWLPVERQN